MKASLGRIELIPILASREQPSPWGDNDTATKSCSERHLISCRTSSEAAPLTLEGRELVRKSLINAIACVGRVLHSCLASESLPQLETVSSARSSHSPRFAKKSHAPRHESNTNPTGFRDFVSKRFRQIAKLPVGESLLLLKTRFAVQKTVEDGSQAVCSQHTRTPPRRHALSTRAGAAASRGGGIRGRRQQNLPLVRVWGRKAPRNVTRGRFWRKRARWGRPRRARRASSPWPAARTSRR